MYSQKFAAAIKCGGKVLREFKDTVYVPFSTEYTILLKNLNTVRAIVNVFIDGENVVPGGLVLRAGQEVDLERSIKNGNLNEGNRFKFIERTSAVEQHRGIKLEDGVVRIEYQFEKVFRRQDGMQWNNTPWNSTGYNPDKFYTTSAIGSPLRNIQCSSSYSSVSPQAMSVSTVDSCAATGFVNDAGITVPGSKSEQKFQTTSWFATESETHSIVLKLLGETADNKPVQEPVTVKAKQKCTTCGRQNKATAKFCQECGTSLVLFDSNLSRPILKVS